MKLNEITKEKEQTEQLLEEKMERWEYLEDLAAKIAGQQYKTLIFMRKL